VRHGDDQWFDLVKWVHFAMVNAEELNVDRANVDEQLKSDNPEIKRMLGTEDNFGERLGLSKDWVYRIVKLVGNYGEVFDRNVGEGSALRIARGLGAAGSRLFGEFRLAARSRADQSSLRAGLPRAAIHPDPRPRRSRLLRQDRARRAHMWKSTS
jgi:hypothetical protein